MDKQKQIEEMAKDMLEYGMEKYPTGESVFTETKLREQFYHVFLTYAEHLIQKGYSKVQENAVVLTNEDDIKQYEFSKEISEMGWFDVTEKYSKEKVKKFAERLHSRGRNVPYDGNYYGMVFEDDIDEICKEFTEEKV